MFKTESVNVFQMCEQKQKPQLKFTKEERQDEEWL